MGTDYVLFIHGTNIRSADYADKLIKLINPVTPIKPLVVYWGKVSDQEEEKLSREYRASPIWRKLWFKSLRGRALLQFAGDAALYLSRSIGAEVACLVAEKVKKLKDCTAEDHLHLVTHSLGSVILFDLLFSSRWDDEGVSGHDCVMSIRRAIYGVGSNPEQGIRLSSITTMGSPIGIFSLMNVSPPKGDLHRVMSGHDITPGLVKMLEYLQQDLGEYKLSLPWRNFVHPGDPIASPLEKSLPHLVGKHMMYIDIRDILVPANLIEILKEPVPDVFSDLIADVFRSTSFAIVDGIIAHGSYWQSRRVAKWISQLIKQTRGTAL